MTVQERMTLEVIERGIVLRRAFNASADLVFDATTEPNHVRNWWGPRGTVLSVCEIDPRVGGRWRYVMLGPDGEEIGFSGEYLEIERPSKIVHTEVFEPMPGEPAVVTVTFAERAGRTLVTSTSLYPSNEIRDIVIGTGMEAGAAESFDRLAELVESMG
ncbi:MAG TPA: SRPBCC family protein [Thermomicrobiales bacterium]|nr:SRPBCC family protein [Thermomicrobiales bacterium]